MSVYVVNAFTQECNRCERHLKVSQMDQSLELTNNGWAQPLYLTKLWRDL